jgi:phosphatidylserine/phosphatidylglycerophosphate/cardiolipin synthase-like enzyme
VDKTVTVAEPTIRAQVLDLDRWLIPRQNAEIPRFTLGNQVDVLVDGKAAFAALNTAFGSTGQGDYIYVTAWDLVPTIHLLGATHGDDIQTVFANARRRGTDVRILLFYTNALHRTYDISVWESATWAQIFVDNKTRGASGSQHQKTAAIGNTEGLVSFAGGIDLTTDRWDTPQHRFKDPDAQYEPGDEKPWHDVHTRIRGPAAADIETNFRQRWNDRHKPPDLVLAHPAPAPLPEGPHIVQTLRTFPEHASAVAATWQYDFAPHGEFGLRQAYRKAIDNARDFVYMEDQYFISDEISTSLADAMRRSDHLQVILVMAPAPDTRPKEAFALHQNRFVDRMTSVDPKRVAIYHLVNASGTEIYCHAKLCVIDDIWAIVGSCNMSRRSFTNDPEISVAVLDETIERNRRKFARQLRIELWAEHLGLTPADLPLIDDPMAGMAEWAKRAGMPGSPKPPSQAIRHGPLSPASPSKLWDSEVDPDGSIP